jgi:hypothetical protein
MSIEETLRAQLTAAIRAKDLRTANVIRMISTKIMERRTAKGFTGEVDDALVIEVIGAYKKMLDKAKKDFAAAGERGKEELANLEFESEYCATFLPKSLGEEEVRDAVETAIAEIGDVNPKMAGRVVGVVMKQHKGRVDAGLVKKLVDEALARS